MKRNYPEQDLQKSVAAFLDRALPSDAVWSAINPVSAKSKAAAGLSKAMGLKPGILDLFILWRCKVYFIELKSKTGTVSDDQKTIIIRLEIAGAKCAICKTLESVQAQLTIWRIPLKARLS